MGTALRAFAYPTRYYYNFVRIQQTLKVTPAMAAGVTKRLWEMKVVVDMLEAWEAVQARRA